MTEESSSSTIESSRRKELIKARWGILRNALLPQNPQQNEQQLQHSIHRFSGYNLIQARPVNSESSLLECEWSLRQIEPFLTKFQWDCVQNDSLENNIDRLEIAILALAACFPKGKCMKIVSAVSHSSDSWLESIKQRCQPSVRVLKVSEGLEQPEEASDQVYEAAMVTTLLVQESSTSTKFQTLFYHLSRETNVSDLKSNQNNHEGNGGDCATTNGSHPSRPHFIWTREPRENRLSLDDLVSHRKNNGVDNTGNICVWDSERTLAYLLYNHFEDFSMDCASHNDDENAIPAGVSNSNSIVQPQLQDSKHSSEIHILELGTGMAGLSALSLGIRLAMAEDRTKKNEKMETKKNSFHITLTDGNPSGVKNNAINQYLTKLNSQMIWERKGKYSYYLDLDVNCETLLWTTDLESAKDNNITNQDIILVSDCVHFQNFHAALATTTLRCLRVGASAIFCQPTRGLSLDNFYNLLLTATSSDTDSVGSTSLLSCSWMLHPIIERKHREARLHFNNIYDENLHHPKILVVTKLREISKEDQARFIAYQERYSPIKSKVT